MACQEALTKLTCVLPLPAVKQACMKLSSTMVSRDCMLCSSQRLLTGTNSTSMRNNPLSGVLSLCEKFENSSYREIHNDGAHAQLDQCFLGTI